MNRATPVPTVTGRWTGRARAAVQACASDRAPISLAEVDAAAGLQTRQDSAYLLRPEEFLDLAERLGPGFRALEIAGRRLLRYESHYLDTPDRALYRMHRQGRRRRFKVRTRTYTDTATSFFEVKVKGGRGETIKHRIDIDPRAPGVRSRTERFLGEVLDAHDLGLDAPLIPSVSTVYRRATFVDPRRHERLTCDVDLVFTDGAGGHATAPDRVLVETKAGGMGSHAAAVLAELGQRPLSMSKYAIATAVLDPTQPANKWDRVLRREFGRVREAA